MKDAILNLSIGAIIVGAMFLLGQKVSLIIGVCIILLCVLYTIGGLVRLVFGMFTGKDMDIE